MRNPENLKPIPNPGTKIPTAECEACGGKGGTGDPESDHWYWCGHCDAMERHQQRNKPRSMAGSIADAVTEVIYRDWESIEQFACEQGQLHQSSEVQEEFWKGEIRTRVANAIRPFLRVQ